MPLNLLFEIGTEEIPASYIAPALEHLAIGAVKMFDALRLDRGEGRVAGTPRRLALFVENVAARQPDVEEEVIGPPTAAAYRNGALTPAGEGFLRRYELSESQMVVKKVKKGKSEADYLTAVVRRAGRPAAELLPDALGALVRGIGFPKSMHWAGKDLVFARPIRSVLALLGGDVVALRMGDVPAGRVTHGHPFLAPGAVSLSTADWNAYVNALRERFVIVAGPERRASIERLVAERMGALSGDALARAADDLGADVAAFVGDLADEVANLVEFPGAVVGSFDAAFLDVPAPVLVSAMRKHQRYFPVFRSDGRLDNRFIAISNRKDDPSGAIRAGNERVLRARLSDARFFWDEDRKRTLDLRRGDLSQIIYMHGLGTMALRTERLAGLASWCASTLGYDHAVMTCARRAGELSKCDLATEMVGEFPDLQGIMGDHYARVGGEPADVGVAIREHYLPSGRGSALPRTPAGRALALAERFDAIVGCFALGLIPTGSADPYKLRRYALGILAIARDTARPFSLRRAVREAMQTCAQQRLPTPGPAAAEGDDAKSKKKASRRLEGDALEAEVLAFLRERVSQTALEAGRPHDYVRAVLAAGFDDVCDVHRRLDALAELSTHPRWLDLVTLINRTHNITRGSPDEFLLDPARLAQPEEQALHAAFERVAPGVRARVGRAEYVAASLEYLALLPPLHAFFEKVFVSVEDQRLRANRLALLKSVNRLYTERIANLAEIVLGPAP
ncbi:MAG: glycine--tRNA ligase subunit beta [Planctomycetes bacterium]|nr:glycine--tRNA ligase subunit beta [Planctomycetota bacterium]